MLSSQKIEELQRILREEYGKDLAIEEVREIAHGLVSYFDLLAQIHHRRTSQLQYKGLSVGPL